MSDTQVCQLCPSVRYLCTQVYPDFHSVRYPGMSGVSVMSKCKLPRYSGMSGISECQLPRYQGMSGMSCTPRCQVPRYVRYVSYFRMSCTQVPRYVSYVISFRYARVSGNQVPGGLPQWTGRSFPKHCQELTRALAGSSSPGHHKSFFCVARFGIMIGHRTTVKI